MKRLLQNADPRVLLLAILTVLAVLFCLYKMVDALTGSESTPAYQRTPPTAFAIPLVDTIVDPQKLNQPRLPDEAYVSLEESSKQLSDKIGRQAISVVDLRQAGMNPGATNSALRQVQSYYGLYRGREVIIEPLQLGSVAPDAAEVIQPIVFEPGADGSPPGGSFTVQYDFSFNVTDNSWSLSGLTVDF